jgi:peptidoglycan/xylan/chitin deacetylase (PgdA/CDA1 family)
MVRFEASAFRMDRWMTLSVVAPLSRVRQAPRRGAIPILMYHSVADDVDRQVGPYYRTVTTPATFAMQMALLRRLGFHSLTLAQALELGDARDGPACPSQPIVITFDDGFRDMYSTAFPLLRACGFNATVFVSTAYLGADFINGRPCLSPAQVRELSGLGIEFGSHTAHHPQLSGLSKDAVIREIVESKQRIEDLVGTEVASFSYPYRFPEENRRFVGELGLLLRQHGYRTGVTTAIGVSTPRHDPLFLPRLPINDGDDAPLFEAKLGGAYDWLHAVQLTSKRLRASWPRRLHGPATSSGPPAPHGASSTEART